MDFVKLNTINTIWFLKFYTYNLYNIGGWINNDMYGCTFCCMYSYILRRSNWIDKLALKSIRYMSSIINYNEFSQKRLRITFPFFKFAFFKSRVGRHSFYFKKSNLTNSKKFYLFDFFLSLEKSCLVFSTNPTLVSEYTFKAVLSPIYLTKSFHWVFFLDEVVS